MKYPKGDKEDKEDKEDICRKNNPIRSKIVLKQGYENLREKTVAIIGLGGTGSTAATLLSRYPFKKLILIDYDIIEHTNLERQILYSSSDVGKKKAVVAKKKLKGFCEIESYSEFFDGRSSSLKCADLVIDCTDNNESRVAINCFCIGHRIPWIHTGAIGRIGAVFFVDVLDPKSPCFECFSGGKSGEKCSQAGVLNSIVSLIGSLAVSMAIDYLASGKVEKDMLRINLDTNILSKIKVTKDKNCSCCAIR